MRIYHSVRPKAYTRQQCTVGPCARLAPGLPILVMCWADKCWQGRVQPLPLCIEIEARSTIFQLQIYVDKTSECKI
jgi:hypothetical protein